MLNRADAYIVLSDEKIALIRKGVWSKINVPFWHPNSGVLRDIRGEWHTGEVEVRNINNRYVCDIFFMIGSNQPQSNGDIWYYVMKPDRRAAILEAKKKRCSRY